jgi:hypothetical protein
MLPKDLLVHLEKHDGKRMAEILSKPIRDNYAPSNLNSQLVQLAQYQQMAIQNQAQQYYGGLQQQNLGGLIGSIPIGNF